MERCYIAIDLKSFYASVECVERGLDPLAAKLVVADASRTEKTICLAVSPALKAYGIPGRARLFEVYQKARGVDFIIAPPRMKKYLDVSQKIMGIYANYVAAEDIHPYSIDEVFMDVTMYLKSYKMTAHELTQTIIQDVLDQTGITATAGIGSNMYLAKIAMDIEAKHMPADKNGVRIAELNERTYREKLWNHTPITDFWRIGPGYKRRLENLGIHTMGELARYSLTGAQKLYKVFGINAELLIDHAWGWEPVTMTEVKNYQSENHSLGSGQVLMRPYKYAEAKLIVWEMADALALSIFEKNIVTDQIVLTVGYDTENRDYDDGQIDRYGRKVPTPAHGTMNLDGFTNSARKISEKTVELFEKIVNPKFTVRRINIEANHARLDSDAVNNGRQLDIFTDYEKARENSAREKRLQEAAVKIKRRYGKNALLKLKNFEDAATMRERNRQMGGHKA